MTRKSPAHFYVTFVALAVILVFASATRAQEINEQRTLTRPTVPAVAKLKSRQQQSSPSKWVTFQPAVTYSTGGIPSSVVVADVNGDGKPDIITANTSCCAPGGVAVLLGNGNGTFQSALVTPLDNVGETDALAVADVNADGRLDLIVQTCCETGKDSQAAVMLGNGDGTFQAPVFYDLGGTSSTIAVADVNADGKPDIVSANFNGVIPASVTVLLGNGNGTFQAAISSPGPPDASCITVADLNNDGKPDAIVCSENTARVLWGNGDGTFPTFHDSFTGYCMSTVAVADLRGNGILDMIAPNTGPGPNGCSMQGYAGILMGNGDGTFQPEFDYPATRSNAFAVGNAAIADVNGDGKLDIMIASGFSYGPTPEPVAVLLGNGDGTFQPATLFNTALAGPTAIVAADLNGDGKPDLVVGTLSSYSMSVSVLLNNTSSGTNTTLTSSLNPSIYGEKVILTATVINNSGPTPTGKVTFTWGIYTLGAATLNSSGVATLTKSNLNADTYPIVATYKGDPNNPPSSSQILNQVVNQATSATTLTSSPNPSTLGQTVTLTAKVTSRTVKPTGPVMFTFGTTFLGTASLNSTGLATLSTSSLPVGSDVVTATFNGDSDISKSSASVTQVVQ